MGSLHRAAIALAVVLSTVGCGDGPLAPRTWDSPPRRSSHPPVDCDTNEDLRAAIDAAEAAGRLNEGRATALRTKLAQADRWETEGRPDRAAGARARLIAQIEAWVAEGALTEEEAAELLACAQDVADGPDAEFAQVSAGGAFTCGLTTEGQAYCWGRNGEGQLGDGTNIDSNTPVAVARELTFVFVNAGPIHACGLTTEGRAYCWGQNGSGQLGDGTTSDRNTPAAVHGTLVFTDVSAGSLHTCGLTDAGLAYCWGQNGSGQLGDGTTIDRHTPVAVTVSSLTFADVSAGATHSCGVSPSGDAYCWGSNHVAQLGDGTNTSSATPVPVGGGVAGFTRISAAFFHTCGLATAGQAYCWGGNPNGQLGNGTTVISTTPSAVARGLTFVRIGTGSGHTCAANSTGEGHCWGSNLFGQLGDGTESDRAVPSDVAGGLAFVNVDGGGSHSCGLTTAAAVYCWGRNNFGQLGDGTLTARIAPVAVLSP